MIDTLTLTTKATVPMDILRQWNYPTTYHHDHDNNVLYSNYNYQVGGAASPRINYTLESKKLKVTIPSMPKFCFGTSAIAIDDNHVDEALSLVEQYVLDSGVEDLPPVNTWEGAFADIYYDFQVGADVANYITSLQSRTLSGYKGNHYANETAAWVRNRKGCTIMFYDRETRCMDTHEDALTTHFSQGVIRMELETHAYDYKRNYGFTDIGSIYKSSVILPMLKRYLERLDLDSLRITTERDLFTILTNKYGQKRARTLMSYINSRYNGYTLDVNRSTIYRYKQDIEAAGVAPVIGIRRLDPLEISTIPDTTVRLAEAEAYRQSTQNVSVIKTMAG